MSDHEAHLLRREVLACERGRGKRYPEALRHRLRRWIRRRAVSGVSLREIAAEVGLSAETVRRWNEEAATASTALVRVEVDERVAADPAAPHHLTLVSPAGYRLERLTIEQAAAILRVVG